MELYNKTASKQFILVSIVISLFFILIPLLIIPRTQAATITWDGEGADNNWSTCTNWVGDVCPGSGSTVSFTSISQTDSIIDPGFGSSIYRIELQANYTGTLTFARDIDVTNFYIQNGGNANLGSSIVKFKEFAAHTGTFTSSSSTLTVEYNFYLDEAVTFNANGGEIIFHPNASTTTETYYCGNAVFNLISFAPGSNLRTLNISDNCSFPMGNDPNFVNANTSLNLYGTLSGTGTFDHNSFTSSGNLYLYSTSQLLGFSNIELGSTRLNNYDASNWTSFTNISITGLLTLQNNSSLNLSNIGSGTIDITTLQVIDSNFTAPPVMSVAQNFTISGSSTFNANNGEIVFDPNSSNADYTYTCNNSTFNLISFAPGSLLRTLTINDDCNFELGNNPNIVRYSTSFNVYGTILGTGIFDTTPSSGSLYLYSTAQISGFESLILESTRLVDFDASNWTSFTNISITGLLTLQNNSSLNLSNIGSGTIDITTLQVIDSNFTAPPVMSVAQNFTISGSSTFNANNGEIVFDPNSSNADYTYTCNNSTFNLISFAPLARVDDLTISADCNLPLGNNPTIINASPIFLYGTFSGTGHFDATNTFEFYWETGGNIVGFDELSFDRFRIDDGINIDLSSFNKINFYDNIAVLSGSTLTLPNLSNSVQNALLISITNSTLSGTGILAQTNAELLFTGSSQINGFTDIEVSEFILNGSTLDLSSLNSLTTGLLEIRSGSVLTAPATINLSLDFNLQSGGTFNHNNGTVNFIDSTSTYQYIRGGVTFYNLSRIMNDPTSRYLRFSNNNTTTILNDLTLRGTDTTNRLILRGESLSNPWTIDPQGNRDLLYLDVANSINANASTIILSGTGSNNGGNNTNYDFANNIPDVPDNLGPVNSVSGNIISDFTPSMNFTLDDSLNPLDTLQYNIQISTTSDYSNIIIDYTSELDDKGVRSFTVGQAEGLGIYNVGSAGQSLPIGNYYWKVKAIDNNAAESSYALANSGNIAFTISGAPYNPTNLGPTNKVNGTVSAESQPTLNFSITDPDVGDTVRYQIQVDDTSNFSSPIIDYTSDLSAQGAFNFTVGQAAGSGSYTVGSDGQSLPPGSYYWRVKGIDDGTEESGYSTANNGSIAFRITTPPNDPTNLGPANRVDGSSTLNTQPTLSFNLSDPDVGDTVRYQIQIDDSNDFSSPIVNYESTLLSQGNNSYTVGQAEGGGTYFIGSVGQVLAETDYYWRVKAIDNNGVESGYVVANGGGIAFSVGGGAPDAPLNLGPENVVTNGVISLNQPTLSFEINDLDVADTVKYRIQISTVSNFTSIVLDYTSALGSQGSRSYTVGEDNGGSYTVGSEGQTLNSGSYYWRVKGIDNTDLESAYTVANGGNIAFSISNSPSNPSNLGPANLVNGSTIFDVTPEVSFELSDPNSGELIRYNVQISSQSDFSTTVIDFTSGLGSQGIRTFIVNSALPSGNYYWRVKAIDQFDLESTFVPANNGDVAFTVIAPPNTPDSLGPGSSINGSTSVNTQPSFSFDIDDPDSLEEVRYQIQIDDSNDFSSPVIDYTSELLSQGVNIFTVGQTEGAGTYTLGNSGQILSSGSYYWRVKAIDEANNESTYRTVNSGNIAFQITASPNDPFNLGPLTVVGGGDSGSTQPTFTIDINDPDVSDTVRFRIQISNTSDFSNIITDYSSALSQQGSFTFTVGQAAGGGSYNIGSQGQSYGNGGYYWRVSATDSNDISSNYTTANNGSVAFTIGGVPDAPSNLGPSLFIDASLTQNTTPTLTFDLSDPDILDNVRYQVQISENIFFSSIVVDYTSELGAQGMNSFTVGQAAGSGSYAIGNVGQSLASNTYYWRVRTIDQDGLASVYTEANNGNTAFILSGTPNDPSNLGPFEYTNSSLVTDSTPTLTFEISDNDVSEELKYQIQVDDNSDFSSPVIDYTSGLTTQGTKSFTIGSSAGSGTYQTGFLGQRLSSDNYYWRVKVIDEYDLESNYTEANNLSHAFELSASPDDPSNLGPTASIDASSDIDSTPRFVFTIFDPDSFQQVGYQIQIDDNSDFSSPVVDYTSALGFQDIRNFEVGQSALGGTYTIGSVDQELVSGDYYWRVRGYDQNGNTSGFSTANSGSVAFRITRKPNQPANKTSANLSDGSTLSTNRPSFTFEVTDPDPTDLVRYQIQIADNKAFTSLVVNYISPLTTQGEKTFTVGQGIVASVFNPNRLVIASSLGPNVLGASFTSGYEEGSPGQSLDSGDYYWRVRTIDEGGITSDYIQPSGDNISFEIQGQSVPEDSPGIQYAPSVPTNFGPSSNVTGGIIINNTPIISFDLSDQNSGQSVKYQIQIDDNSDFSSLIIDFESILGSQGSRSYTVGQGGGTYYVGGDVSSLPNGPYYVRVRTIDASSLSSSYEYVNSGNTAFIVDYVEPEIQPEEGEEPVPDEEIIEEPVDAGEIIDDETEDQVDSTDQESIESESGLIFDDEGNNSENVPNEGQNEEDTFIPDDRTEEDIPVPAEDQTTVENNIINSTAKFISNNPISIPVSAGAIVVATYGLAYPKLILLFFAILKNIGKRKEWGIIYDQDSFKPIPFVTIRLYDDNESFIEETVTGFDGKFGFSVEKGKYGLEIRHSNYKPINKKINISKTQKLIVEDFALKSLTSHDKVSLIKKLQIELRDTLDSLHKVIFIVATIFSLYSAITNPQPVSVVLAAGFILSILIYTLRIMLIINPLGYVYDIESSDRIGGLRIRVIEKDTNKLKDILISDKDGTLRFKENNEDYLLMVNDENYSLPDTNNGVSTAEKKKADKSIKIGLERKKEKKSNNKFGS